MASAPSNLEGRWDEQTIHNNSRLARMHSQYLETIESLKYLFDGHNDDPGLNCSITRIGQETDPALIFTRDLRPQNQARNQHGGPELVHYIIRRDPTYGLNLSISPLDLGNQFDVETIITWLVPTQEQDRLRHGGFGGGPAISLTDEYGAACFKLHPCGFPELAKDFDWAKDSNWDIAIESLRFLLRFISTVGGSVGLNIPLEVAQAISRASLTPGINQSNAHGYGPGPGPGPGPSSGFGGGFAGGPTPSSHQGPIDQSQGQGGAMNHPHSSHYGQHQHAPHYQQNQGFMPASMASTSYMGQNQHVHSAQAPSMIGGSIPAFLPISYSPPSNANQQYGGQGFDNHTAHMNNLKAAFPIQPAALSPLSHPSYSKLQLKTGYREVNKELKEAQLARSPIRKTRAQPRKSQSPPKSPVSPPKTRGRPRKTQSPLKSESPPKSPPKSPVSPPITPQRPSKSPVLPDSGYCSPAFFPAEFQAETPTRGQKVPTALVAQQSIALHAPSPETPIQQSNIDPLLLQSPCLSVLQNAPGPGTPLQQSNPGVVLLQSQKRGLAYHEDSAPDKRQNRKIDYHQSQTLSAERKAFVRSHIKRPVIRCPAVVPRTTICPPYPGSSLPDMTTPRSVPNFGFADPVEASKQANIEREKFQFGNQTASANIPTSYGSNTYNVARSLPMTPATRQNPMISGRDYQISGQSQQPSSQSQLRFLSSADVEIDRPTGMYPFRNQPENHEWKPHFEEKLHPEDVGCSHDWKFWIGKDGSPGCEMICGCTADNQKGLC